MIFKSLLFLSLFLEMQPVLCQEGVKGSSIGHLESTDRAKAESQIGVHESKLSLHRQQRFLPMFQRGLQDTTKTDKVDEKSKREASPTINKEDILEKSPGWAVMRSLVFPGWGQFYTDQRVKGSIILVAETSFFVLFAREKKKANEAQRRFDETMSPLELDEKEIHLGRADDYRFWGIMTILYSIIDAYVSANLYNFKEKINVEETGEGRVEFSVNLVPPR